MRVLAISSAYGGAACAVIDGCVRGSLRITEERGLAAALPGRMAELLAESGQALDLVAVAVGPGSFTGLRAGIALATGIGLALGVPVVGVTVTEALSTAFAAQSAADGRTLWTAIEARKGRVFIDMGDGARGYPADALPPAEGRIAVCGNAANWVAGTLAARGADVMLTPLRMAQPADIAAVGVQRAEGRLPALAASPLYVDAPEARLPAQGLRAAPL
jgi:tRNA threonylcarbamoyladenosine biosynthesis protein TsaB